MTTGILIAKVGSAVAAAASVVGGTYFVISKHLNKPDSSKNYVVAVQKATSTSGSSKYLCKLTDNPSINDDDCVIKKLSLKTDHKKQINSSDLTSSDLWQNVDTNSFNTANSYYKIEVSDTLFNALKNDVTKTIDIFAKTNSNDKVTTLTAIYSVDKNSAVTTKTEYAVGKVSQFLQSNGTASTYTQNGPITISDNGVKCDFTGTTENNNVTCEILQFAASQTNPQNIDALSFSTNTTKQTSINKGHFYLFKLTSSNSAQLPKDYLLSTPVKATVTTPSAPSQASDIAKLEISDLKPVFFNSTDSSSPIFFHTGAATRS